MAIARLQDEGVCSGGEYDKILFRNVKPGLPTKRAANCRCSVCFVFDQFCLSGRRNQYLAFCSVFILCHARVIWWTMSWFFVCVHSASYGHRATVDEEAQERSAAKDEPAESKETPPDLFGGYCEDDLVVGTEVVVVKPGSSKYGRHAIVRDPNWHNMVKVNMDGEIKSYEKEWLRLALPPEEEEEEEEGGTKKKLPKGWTLELEKGTGTTYYYNVFTGESVWERPVVSAAKLRDDAALIIMNMQRDFFENLPSSHNADDGSELIGEEIDLEKIEMTSPCSSRKNRAKLPVADVEECLSNIEKLRSKFPFRLTFHCRCIRPPNHCSFVSSHPGLREMADVRVGETSVSLHPDHCIDGTLGSDFHPAISTDKDIVVNVGGQPRRNDYSPFTIENESIASSSKDKHYKAKPLVSMLLRNRIRQVPQGEDNWYWFYWKHGLLSDCSSNTSC